MRPLNFFQDGTFLIRESTKQGHIQPYTMMVLFQNNIYNLKIRVRPDGKMALGEEKPDEIVRSFYILQ